MVGYKAMQPKEPEYQGRKLSEWIADLNEPPPKYDAAVASIRQMKQTALPIIEARLIKGRKRGGWERFLLTLDGKTGVGRRYSEAFQWEVDFKALEAIGNDAIPVIERLFTVESAASPATRTLAELEAVESLNRACQPNQKGRLRLCAIAALLDIKRRREEVSPILIHLTGDNDSDVKISAVEALGILTVLPEKAIPRLCELLETEKDDVKEAAIYSLQAYGTNALTAVPALQKLAAGNDITLRAAAQEALSKIKLNYNP